MNPLNMPDIVTDQGTTMTIALPKADGLLVEVHGANAALDVAEAFKAAARRITADELERMTPGGMEMVFHAPLYF